MKKTTLTTQDIEKIARLARLTIKTGELTSYADQLSDVLSYFNKLNEVDTSEIPPTFHAFSDENRFQEQAQNTNTLQQDQVLKNSKENKNGYVLTNAVMDKS